MVIGGESRRMREAELVFDVGKIQLGTETDTWHNLWKSVFDKNKILSVGLIERLMEGKFIKGLPMIKEKGWYVCA